MKNRGKENIINIANKDKRYIELVLKLIAC
jgi:hypothetical protein